MAIRRKKVPPRRLIVEPFKINDKITSETVRLVGDNITPGLYSLKEALSLASQAELDLVEISPQGDTPICKIIDYLKFKYDKKKKEREIKAKAQKTTIKEIRFGPNTGEHDFNFKLKHAINFLKQGSQLKVYVSFMGRAVVYKERGELLLLRFAEQLAAYGKVDHLPTMEVGSKRRQAKMIINIFSKVTKKE